VTDPRHFGKACNGRAIEPSAFAGALAGSYLVVGSVILILRSSNISGLFYCGGTF
jgi:hypothetical protein